MFKPPTAAREVILEAVNMPLVDEATDGQVSPLKDRNGDRQYQNEVRLCLQGENCGQSEGDSGNILVSEWGRILVWAKVKEFGDNGLQLNEHEGNFGVINWEEFRVE